MMFPHLNADICTGRDPSEPTFDFLLLACVRLVEYDGVDPNYQSSLKHKGLQSGKTFQGSLLFRFELHSIDAGCPSSGCPRPASASYPVKNIKR